jgi:hypothetical protein
VRLLDSWIQCSLLDSWMLETSCIEHELWHCQGSSGQHQYHAHIVDVHHAPVKEKVCLPFSYTQLLPWL